MNSQELTDRIKLLESQPDSPQNRVAIADAYWARRRAWEKEQNISVVTHEDGCPV